MNDKDMKIRINEKRIIVDNLVKFGILDEVKSDEYKVSDNFYGKYMKNLEIVVINEYDKEFLKREGMLDKKGDIARVLLIKAVTATLMDDTDTLNYIIIDTDFKDMVVSIEKYVNVLGTFFIHKDLDSFVNKRCDELKGN